MRALFLTCLIALALFGIWIMPAILMGFPFEPPTLDGARAYLDTGVLAYGDGPRPVPGVGAEQQLLLSLGDDIRFELGAGASQDLVDGKLQLGVSGVAGLRIDF